MAVGIIYNCDVCGCEVTSYSGYNHDGVLHIANGDKPSNNFYMCPSCTNDVCEFIYGMQYTFGMYNIEHYDNN